MVYHLAGDPDINVTIKRTNVQPIMFMSKLLNTAESNYWPTELEVAGIVWAVKKIRHLIESSEVPPVIVYTDHSAAVPIARQTTLTTSSTDKLNLRLVRASQYLSMFPLSIRHKSGKSNIVPDALSRLPSTNVTLHEDSAGILDALYGCPVESNTHGPPLVTESPVAYTSTLVEISDTFRDKITAEYLSDARWSKIWATVHKSEEDRKKDNTFGDFGLRFTLRNNLIYFQTHEGAERLYIP